MRKRELLPPILLTLPLVAGALLTGLDYPLTWDEPAYYFVSLQFGDNYLPTIDELKSYTRFDATPLSVMLFGF